MAAASVLCELPHIAADSSSGSVASRDDPGPYGKQAILWNIHCDNWRFQQCERSLP